jgi:hypothetical protein
MVLGIRSTRLWRLRAGAVVCVVLSLLAAVWSVWKIDLLPPRLQPRALDMATASTSVMIDNPKSVLLDPTQDTYSLEALTDRAVLLGTVMANAPVRDSIARRAGIPASVLKVEAPLTPQQPRAPLEKGKEKHTSDILRSTDQYRLDMEVDPAVPVLDLYTQAPSAGMAVRLANAAVDAARVYVDQLAKSEGTPLRYQVRVRQLGRAQGAVINDGVRWQVAMLVFFLAFALGCAGLFVISRMVDGWRTAALTERPAEA